MDHFGNRHTARPSFFRDDPDAMTFYLSPAAHVILEHLTWGARASTVEQVDRVLQARYAKAPQTGRLLRRLAEAGLVELDTVVAAFPDVMEPLWIGTPRGPVPPCHAIAWELEKRWRTVRPRRLTIVWATAMAARLCGGIAALPRRLCQLEHDLGTAGVLARLHECRPGDAAGWIGEDILRRDYAPVDPRFRKIPDGAVVDHGRIVAVHELAGQYSVRRLQQFCRSFQTIPSYEIW